MADASDPHWLIGKASEPVSFPRSIMSTRPGPGGRLDQRPTSDYGVLVAHRSKGGDEMTWRSSCDAVNGRLVKLSLGSRLRVRGAAEAITPRCFDCWDDGSLDE